MLEVRVNASVTYAAVTLRSMSDGIAKAPGKRRDSGQFAFSCVDRGQLALM